MEVPFLFYKTEMLRKERQKHPFYKMDVLFFVKPKKSKNSYNT